MDRGKLSGAGLLSTKTTFFSCGEAGNGEWKRASQALLLCLCDPARLTDFAACPTFRAGATSENASQLGRSSLKTQPLLCLACRAEYSNGLALPLGRYCIHPRHPEGV